MIATRAVWLTLAVVVATTSACARNQPAPPAPRELQFGARRVQVLVPDGWEALDQGNQKRFRKGEFEIVLQVLGPKAPPPHDFDELIGWGLTALGAGLGHDQGREEKSRRTITVDGHETVDIETWSRLDHTNPQRIFFVRDEDELLALRTERMALEDTLAAFDAIRDSLHFVSVRR